MKLESEKAMAPERRSMLWRVLRVLVILAAVLATVWAIFCVEENWRGKRAWLKHNAELEGKGERLDTAAFIPTPVSPEQNLATTPLFAELFDYTIQGEGERRLIVWRNTNAVNRSFSFVSPKGVKTPDLGRLQTAARTDLEKWQAFFRAGTNYPTTPQPQTPADDVLLALTQYQAVLNELEAACQRPYAVFPVHYEEGIFTLLPHLAKIRELSQIVRLRAAARLEGKQIEGAFQDVQLNFRLADALQPEPLLISQLVRMAILQMNLNVIWEGLVARKWTDPQIAVLIQKMEAIDLLVDFGRAMRGERAFGIQSLGQFQRSKSTRDMFIGNDQPSFATLSLFPGGWLHQNQIAISRMYQDNVLPSVDVAARQITPQRLDEVEQRYNHLKRTPLNILAKLLFPAVAKAGQKFAYQQSLLDLAKIACALERHRLAHGRYPPQLEAITPAFLKTLPHDIINGQSLRFRLDDPNRFTLYSVGWNEKDDGGNTAVSNSGKTFKIDQGDWVWPSQPSIEIGD